MGGHSPSLTPLQHPLGVCGDSGPFGAPHFFPKNIQKGPLRPQAAMWCWRGERGGGKRGKFRGKCLCKIWGGISPKRPMRPQESMECLRCGGRSSTPPVACWRVGPVGPWPHKEEERKKKIFRHCAFFIGGVKKCRRQNNVYREGAPKWLK